MTLAVPGSQGLRGNRDDADTLIADYIANQVKYRFNWDVVSE